MSSKGRQLHAKAEVARETGKFLEALISSDQAIIVYQKAADYLGLAEVLASRQSTFKHLYEKTEDKAYLILEKHAAEAAVEIAKLSKIWKALAIPYHNLGKYYQESGEDKRAVQAFKKAVKYLEKFPPKMHNRPAVLLDIKGHLYAAKYRTGDKSAFKKAAQICLSSAKGYKPKEVKIKKGTKVIFKNQDQDLHWPASNIHPTHTIYPEFDPQRPVKSGESWEFIFDKVGIWRFHDHLLPQVNGTILVVD